MHLPAPYRKVDVKDLSLDDAMMPGEIDKDRFGRDYAISALAMMAGSPFSAGIGSRPAKPALPCHLAASPISDAFGLFLQAKALAADMRLDIIRSARHAAGGRSMARALAGMLWRRHDCAYQPRYYRRERD